MGLREIIRNYKGEYLNLNCFRNRHQLNYFIFYQTDLIRLKITPARNM